MKRNLRLGGGSRPTPSTNHGHRRQQDCHRCSHAGVSSSMRTIRPIPVRAAISMTPLYRRRPSFPSRTRRLRGENRLSLPPFVLKSVLHGRASCGRGHRFLLVRLLNPISLLHLQHRLHHCSGFRVPVCNIRPGPWRSARTPPPVHQQAALLYLPPSKPDLSATPRQRPP
jgi:hypothetical protein